MLSVYLRPSRPVNATILEILSKTTLALIIQEYGSIRDFAINSNNNCLNKLCKINFY